MASLDNSSLVISSNSALAMSIISCYTKSSAREAAVYVSRRSALMTDLIVSYKTLPRISLQMSSRIASLSTIMSDISPMMVLHIFMDYCFLICSVNDSCRSFPLIVCRYAPVTYSDIALTSVGFIVLRSRTYCIQSGTFAIEDLLSSVFRSYSRNCIMKAGTFAIELRFSSGACDSRS